MAERLKATPDLAQQVWYTAADPTDETVAEFLRVHADVVARWRRNGWREEPPPVGTDSEVLAQRERIRETEAKKFKPANAKIHAAIKNLSPEKLLEFVAREQMEFAATMLRTMKLRCVTIVEQRPKDTAALITAIGECLQNGFENWEQISSQARRESVVDAAVQQQIAAAPEVEDPLDDRTRQFEE